MSPAGTAETAATWRSHEAKKREAVGNLLGTIRRMRDQGVELMMLEARRRIWPRDFPQLERDVSDPKNRTPIVCYVRALRSMTAEVSLGRVSARVNGFGIVKGLRIAPEMYCDPERLGRLVSRAVNLANNEVWRRSPSPPSSLPWSTRSVSPRPPTPAHLGGALTESELASWRDEVPGNNEVQRRAFIDAAHVVRERILRDAAELPGDLAALLHVVHRRLGDIRLSAVAVRRAAGVGDPDWSRRFQRAARFSLTRYIQQRHAEVAARMAYRSDLTLDEIARMFGYIAAMAITNVIRYRGCRQSPEDLRYFWERGGVDYILFKWAAQGKATPEQSRQAADDVKRMTATVGFPPSRPWGPV